MRLAVAMGTMAMEKVHQRAGHQQHEWQIVKDVRAVLRQQVVKPHRRERPECPSHNGLSHTVMLGARRPAVLTWLKVQSLVRFNRKALLTTETELIAIAAPAKIGESSRPKKG